MCGKNVKIGRPIGWRKAEGTHKQRQMRTTKDEWELIKRFEKLIKYGDKQACIEFLNQHK